MKQSLKSQLNLLIRIRGEVSYSEIKWMCENGKFGGRKFRIETADRRLRRSESPNIEPVIKDGYITAWRWAGQPLQYQTYRVLDDNGQPYKEIKIVKAEAIQNKLL
jgi:hypothetical protein